MGVTLQRFHPHSTVVNPARSSFILLLAEPYPGRSRSIAALMLPSMRLLLGTDLLLMLDLPAAAGPRARHSATYPAAIWSLRARSLLSPRIYACI